VRKKSTDLSRTHLLDLITIRIEDLVGCFQRLANLEVEVRVRVGHDAGSREKYGARMRKAVFMCTVPVPRLLRAQMD
jgi:hypothetical protein